MFIAWIPLSLSLLGQLLQSIDNTKIYHYTCSQRSCLISTLTQELAVPRTNFVAIPIPDSLSGCILESKLMFILIKHFSTSK